MPGLTRRVFLRTAVSVGGGLACGLGGCKNPASRGGQLRLATFSVDVTPPVGHPCMGGGIAPVQRIDDPLYAKGIVLLGAGDPFVLAAVDWCEIRNDAYERWREALAAATGAQPKRVLLSSVHQHDAPVADLTAQRILEERRCAGGICLLEFHETTVRRVAAAARRSLREQRRVTHLGLGKAKVEQVASNRRFLGPGGKPLFSRTSSTKDPAARAAPENTIDPWLRTLSFWEGERPLAALSCYATHPMSYYGKGGASSDFVGLARQRRQADDPGVFQVYASGCSGNVTAGKYNDGSSENRPVLAERIYQGMVGAWRSTRREAVGACAFRCVPLRLPVRAGPGFTEADLHRKLGPAAKPFEQCLAALGLSWQRRVAAGRPIDVPVLDFGCAQALVLPAEAYVEYQLLAQQLRPDVFLVVLGYGECAPGYIPIERAWAEGDTNLHDWCWVGPGSEQAMNEAIAAVLTSPATPSART